VRAGKFIKTTAIFFLGTVITKLISFCLLPIYTAYILPKDYGYFDLSTTVIGAVVSIVYFEMWTAIMRFMYDKSDHYENKQIISSGLLMFLFSSILYATLLVACSFFIRIQNIEYIGLFGFLSALQNYSTFTCRANGRNIVFVISGIISTLLNIISNIICIIIFKMGYESLFISAIIGMIGQILIIEFSQKTIANADFRMFKPSLLKAMFAFALPLSINSIVFFFLVAFNKIYISYRLGLSDNGYYAVASKFSIAITLIASCVQLAWQDEVFSGQGKESSQYYSKACDIYIRYLLSGLLLLIPLIRVVYPFLVTESYAGARGIIPLCILGSVASIFSNFLGQIFGALKETRIILKSTLIAAIANCSLIMLLVGICGLQSANIALFIAFMVNSIIRINLLKKKIKLIINLRIIILVFMPLFIAEYFVYYFLNAISNICVLAALIAIVVSINRDDVLWVLRSTIPRMWRYE
jgi:O-antigen/teichoic acid export membrane protein